MTNLGDEGGKVEVGMPGERGKGGLRKRWERKDGGNGKRKMWGIMKDEEEKEEVTWGFHIHFKMPQLHPEPTQQPCCVFDKSYDCPDKLRGGETCSAFWSVLTTHKHTRTHIHTHSQEDRHTHTAAGTDTLCMCLQAIEHEWVHKLFYCKWFSLYEGICAV